MEDKEIQPRGRDATRIMPSDICYIPSNAAMDEGPASSIKYSDGGETGRWCTSALWPSADENNRQDTYQAGVRELRKSQESHVPAVFAKSAASESGVAGQPGEGVTNPNTTHKAKGKVEHSKATDEATLEEKVEKSKVTPEPAHKTEVKEEKPPVEIQRGNQRPVIKPDRYDGKGPWESYIKHFELCGGINGWNDESKCQYLAIY